MRLIGTFSLQFEEFPDAASRPPYIVLSHLWTGDEQISYKGMLNAAHKSSQNCVIIEDFARYIQQNIPWIRHLWTDSYCINEQDDVELVRSLRCMFKWHKQAVQCFTLLNDVGDDDNFTNTDRGLRTSETANGSQALGPHNRCLLLDQSYSLHKAGS
jgi:hypothetical protein